LFIEQACFNCSQKHHIFLPNLLIIAEASALPNENDFLTYPSRLSTVSDQINILNNQLNCGILSQFKIGWLFNRLYPTNNTMADCSF